MPSDGCSTNTVSEIGVMWSLFSGEAGRCCLCVKSSTNWGTNNVMPNLVFTSTKGKRHSAKLVSASTCQQPNEIQMRQLDEINRILPPDILSEMSARKLVIPPREIALLLSRLKAAADAQITIGE